MTRVGWVGLGAMGGPMASVAAAEGHEIVAFDVEPRAVDRAQAAGAVPAASAADAARGADALVLMVATEAQVTEVLFGPDGAAAELLPGAVVLVMATIGPEAVIRCSDRLAEHGVALVDAPVSGGVARAGSGDLLIMVSGEPSSVSVVFPLLQSLARSAHIVGDAVGDGQKVKLVNQLLCGVHIAAAAEALAFAGALGLDARQCWEAVRGGAAASFMLDDRGERMLDEAFDTPLSAVDIFVKDMDLVAATAESAGSWVPLATTAAGIYHSASGAGLGRKDDSVLIDVIRSGE